MISTPPPRHGRTARFRLGLVLLNLALWLGRHRCEPIAKICDRISLRLLGIRR